MGNAVEHRRLRYSGLIDSGVVLPISGISSLLHFDGTDGSTTFTDETGKSWTPSGTAQIDTDQSKFGGASGLLDGNSDYISTACTTDFQFGSGDFTIDCWVRINSTNAYGQIFQMGGQAGVTYPDIMLYSASKTVIGVEVWTASTKRVGITTPAFTADVFHHIMFARYGKLFYLGVDGVIVSGAEYTGAVDYDSGRPVMVGYQTGQPSNHYFGGWIDELRVVKGHAIMPAVYTIPISAGVV